ncbi:MAG TPA: multidrug efflux RND transporter permease subunit [Polyangiaceae bacterium]
MHHARTRVNISAPFIRRPIGTSLLAAALLLAGLWAYTLLPVAPVPRVDMPTIRVSVTYPGASPETMASSVATPLERYFGRIAGIREITSTNSLGGTSITLQFDLDRDVDGAARDVQAAIAAAASQLPTNLPIRPTYRKVNPADSPILILSLTSPSLPLKEVFEAANTVLAQKIAQVRGVGQVFVGGGQQPAVRVQVDPEALAGAGLSLTDVQNVLAKETVNQPKGSFTGQKQAESLATNDQLLDANAYKPLVLENDKGQVVRLADVANVFDDVENERVAGWTDGQRAVLVIVFRQPDANIIETSDRVQKLLPTLATSISPSIKTEVAFERTVTIRASVRDVQETLILSVVLVTLVVFVFLRDLRATAIPSVAVPLSIVGTFAAMQLLHYSIDNLSLMALTISTGFVVDDAIVVTENIARYVEQGEPPIQAALKGAKQIGFTIVSITVSLLAVFIPILLMGGIVGRVFREFAVTLGIAVAISAVVSLTLTPMMASRLLRPHRPASWLGQKAEAGFTALLRGYERALVSVLRHQVPMLLLTLGAVALTGYLIAVIPKGLFPQQDTGRLGGMSEAPQDVSFARMKARQEALNAVIGKDPDVLHYVSFVGGGGPRANAGNTGSIFISLKDKPERKASIDEVIARLRPQLAKVPGAQLFLQASQDIRVGGRSSRTQYQYTLQSADLREVNEWAPKVFAALKTLPQLKDVATDQQTNGLELDIDIDRDTAARLGITMADVDQTLYDAYGQAFVAVFYTQVNQYHVVLEVTPQYQKGPESLDDIYVKTASGSLVPLTAITKRSKSRTALSVNHESQFPSVTLSFNLAKGTSLGQAMDAIDAEMRRIALPASVLAHFSGTAEAFTASLRSEPLLVAFAIIAVYIVLGMLYESYIHPITILSTLPSASVGALLALLLCKTEFSIIALIGIILLIGIVKKNAIMMVDFAIAAERDEGMSPVEAVRHACVQRFRPILMTTMAAILGGVPLALGRGTGSELRTPLGITLVGGLIFSQMLTLFTTPVIYLALDRFTKRKRRAQEWGLEGPALTSS